MDKEGIKWKKYDFRYGFFQLEELNIIFFKLHFSWGHIEFYDLFTKWKRAVESKEPASDFN